MGIAMAWVWLLVAPRGLGFLGELAFDLGQFNNLKNFMRIAIPLAAVGMILHVRDFLAVRALGLIAILAAAPLLYSAFLEPPLTRLLVPIFAYGMIIKGMYWVGQPYLMRDTINWVTRTDSRYKFAALGGLGYGVAVLVCSILWW